MNDQRLEQLLRSAREVEDLERDLGLLPARVDESAAARLRLHAGESKSGGASGRVQSADHHRRPAGAARWKGPLLGPIVGLVGIAAAFALMIITTRPAPIREPRGGSESIASADGRSGSGEVPGLPSSPSEQDRRLAMEDPSDRLTLATPFGTTILPDANTGDWGGSLALGPLGLARGGPNSDSIRIVAPRGEVLPATVAASDDRRNMVLAMYEGTDPRTGKNCDNCQCVQWWSHEFEQGRALSDVSAGELLGASMEHSCMNTPRRVFIIGLSGPASELPTTEEDARRVFLCILGRQPDHTCSDRDTAMSSAAAACLSSRVDVRVQTWGK